MSAYYGYHGTKKKFDAFRVPDKVSPRNYMQFGIHFAASKDVAAKYAGRGVPIVYARLDLDNLLDARDVINRQDPRYSIIEYVMQNQKRGINNLRRLHLFGEKHDGYHLQVYLGEADRPVAEEALREGGYDGVVYDLRWVRSWGHTGGNGVCYAVLDPSKITILLDCDDQRVIKALACLLDR